MALPLELGHLRLVWPKRSLRLAHSNLDNRKVQAMTFHQTGEIEIDLRRGVVYFHSATGISLLRICGLEFPKDFDPQTGQIDITIRQSVSYGRNAI
jgi:hypothetical protein